jgi:hypothetical protein
MSLLLWSSFVVVTVAATATSGGGGGGGGSSSKNLKELNLQDYNTLQQVCVCSKYMLSDTGGTMGIR